MGQTDGYDYVPGGPNPGGKCKCGCGLFTKPAADTNNVQGVLKGQAQNYIRLHAAHVKWRKQGEWGPHFYTVTDMGYETACWMWNGSKNPRWGYGVTRWKGHTWRAHMRSWVEAGNSIVVGLQLDHLCRQRACVNPDHLEQVTPSVNVRRSSMTKLTADKAAEIRARYAAGGISQKALAREYGVAQSNIWSILSGATWRD